MKNDAKPFMIRYLSRYDLDSSTVRRLRRDLIRFEETYTDKFENAFLCRILVNYLECLPGQDVAQFKEALLTELRQNTGPEAGLAESSRLTVTSALVDKIRTIDVRLGAVCNSKESLRFNEEQEKKIREQQEKQIKDFEKAYNVRFRKRTVINFILKQFVALPLSEREQVYFHAQYQVIRDALRDGNLLQVITTTKPDETYEIQPVALSIDENTGSYYLIGYSRKYGSQDAYKLYTTKLSRIRNCSSLHLSFQKDEAEWKRAYTLTEKFGAAYVNTRNPDEIEKTVVRLTKFGYETLYLKVIAQHRPLPCSIPVSSPDGTFYTLEFECSYDQIMNYLFLFGKEAQVISPESLRKKIIDIYRDALKAYQPTDPDAS